jgi:hypothetical protein
VCLSTENISWCMIFPVDETLHNQLESKKILHMGRIKAKHQHSMMAPTSKVGPNKLKVEPDLNSSLLWLGSQSGMH